MRNIHNELVSSHELYQFADHRPEDLYKQVISMTLSRLEAMLKGSQNFESEESWLLRRDISSTAESIRAALGISEAMASEDDPL